MIQHRDKEDGFTLIELMIAMVLGLLIMWGVYTTFSSQQDAYRIQNQLIEREQNVKFAIDMMKREIRMAGYDPSEALGVGFTIGIIDATAISIRITMDLNGDGDITDTDNSGAEDVTYTFDSVNLRITRNDENTAFGDELIGENINSVTFSYLDSDGVVIAVPVNSPVIRATIRIVQITINAHTSREDPKFTVAAKGYDLDGGGAPYARAQAYTVQIKPRNLGLVKSGT